MLKNLSTLLFALFLAILVWIVAIREQNPPVEGTYNRLIAIEVVPPPTGLTTTDELPNNLQVRINAPQDRWDKLTPEKFKAALDLSDSSTGLNEIPIQLAISDSQVDIIEYEPASVSINLQAEQTQTLFVTVELSEFPALGYISRQPIVTPPTVTVTGPASIISQVDKAVIKVSVRGAKEPIERTRSVLIRDRDDLTINGLEVEPSQIEVIVPIEQRFDYKDVSVSAVVEGQVEPGYWVSNIAVEPATVTIFGDPQVLNALPGFVETAPVHLNQAIADIVQIVPLNLPDGVTVVSSDDQQTSNSAQVTVKVEAIEGGKTIQRPVKQQGVDPNYDWSASPDHVDVILSGPIPLLESITPEEIEVIVNLFELPPGTHKVTPTVFAPEGLQATTILSSVEVTITSQPTVTPTSPPPTLTPTPKAIGGR
ncbi:CdaR family protein [Anaerolineales bacterium HSG6]|nr:CdaR family protein [Anaerolineales bacterium HSG6]MDM8531822.1 CdaR family protein [Anaerolineales bacterium HSG25]